MGAVQCKVLDRSAEQADDQVVEDISLRGLGGSDDGLELADQHFNLFICQLVCSLEITAKHLLQALFHRRCAVHHPFAVQQR
ncbi:hypothetical protein D3C77_509530 [compost metagenome]